MKRFIGEGYGSQTTFIIRVEGLHFSTYFNTQKISKFVSMINDYNYFGH